MKLAHGLLASAALLLVGTDSSGQRVALYSQPGTPYAAGSGVSLGYQRRGVSFYFSSGSSMGTIPIGLPYSIPITPVLPVFYALPVVVTQPAIVVTPAPVFVTPPPFIATLPGQRTIAEELQLELLLQQLRAGGAQVPLPAPLPPAAPAKRENPLPPPARKVAGLPGPPLPAAEPRAEYALQLDHGRDAYAHGGYALAERLFRKAAELLPNETMAHFLLAQSQFSQGKYQEAYVAIQSGLLVCPAWPLAPFLPRELYGPDPAEFTLHLQRLDDARARFADDFYLHYLYAYELWFDGRKDEARQVFVRLQALTPGPVTPFVRPLVNMPLLVL